MRDLALVIAAGQPSIDTKGLLTFTEDMQRVCNHALKKCDPKRFTFVLAGGIDPVTGIRLAKAMRDMFFVGYECETLRAASFDTRGECQEFAKLLLEELIKHSYSCKPITAHVVVRWWHRFRVEGILEREIERLGIEDRVILVFHDAPSREWSGMFREIIAFGLEVTGLKTILGEQLTHWSVRLRSMR